MSSSVDKIKERLSIIDVVSSYITVQKAGKNFRARCPFHNEKTPSFFISSDRGMYYCFGCGAKGDIFSFVEHFEGTDFLGALKILASRAGIVLSNYQKEANDKKYILYEILEEAASFYEKNLDTNKDALEYLSSRGLNKNSIKSFRIGYAPDSWTSVLDHLTGKGYRKEDIEAVGLIKKNEDKNSNRFYDRFRSRIIFPINDSSGRVIAFTGRIFKKDNNSNIEEAKYLNSPDTELFNKSNVLFGLDKAKISIRKRDYTIVVEGQMDLILSHQAGFTNTVAVSGTAFADTIVDNKEKVNNLGLVKRLSSNIIFAYDGDDAGIRAANRSALIALSLDMQVKIAVFPKGKDPADIIGEDYKIWNEIIKNKIDIISFHLDKICESYKDKESIRKQIVEKIFPFLSMIDSSIKKSNYIKEIYNKTGISESAINEDYKKYENKIKSSYDLNIKSKDSGISSSRRSNLEKNFFGIIFWKKQKEDEFIEIEKLIEPFISSIGEDEYNKLFNLYKIQSDDLSLKAEMWYSGKKDIVIDEIKELALNLEEEILNDKLYKLLIEIKENERDKDKDKVRNNLIHYQKIVEKIENIKNRRFK